METREGQDVRVVWSIEQPTWRTRFHQASMIGHRDSGKNQLCPVIGREGGRLRTGGGSGLSWLVSRMRRTEGLQRGFYSFPIAPHLSDLRVTKCEIYTPNDCYGISTCLDLLPWTCFHSLKSASRSSYDKTNVHLCQKSAVDLKADMFGFYTKRSVYVDMLQKRWKWKCETMMVEQCSNSKKLQEKRKPRNRETPGDERDYIQSY